MEKVSIKKKNIYRYDLFRQAGTMDLKTLLKWLFVPKFKIIYIFRKCEYWRSRNKLIFGFYRMIYGHYMVKYGVDIGAKASIGPGFIIRHMGGIVINSYAVIGKDVEIMQGITIGYERRGKRQGNPTIGDRVWIGSNAVIVGKITVGNDVLIAPNAFVNFDVPDNSIVIGNLGQIIRKENAVDEYVINTLELQVK